MEFLNGDSSDVVSIDANSGVLRITNRADKFIDAEVVIRITTSGGREDFIQRTEPVLISSKCSIQSTGIDVAPLRAIEQAVNY